MKDILASTPATSTPTVTPKPGVTLSDGLEGRERNWAMVAHLSGLALYTGLPFGNVIGPLLVWLLKKDESAFVADQAKEALNFQLSLTLYTVVAFVLLFFLVGLLAFSVLFVAHVVFSVVAAVSASEGKTYRYPLTIRFVG